MTEKRIAQLMRWNLNPKSPYYGDEWGEALLYISKIKIQNKAMRDSLNKIKATERNYQKKVVVHLYDKDDDGNRFLMCGQTPDRVTEMSMYRSRVTCKKCLKKRVKIKKKKK